MKWGYGILVVIGAGIGWLILKNYGIKRAIPVAVVEESTIQFTTDSTGAKKQTVELQGVVQNWNSDMGIIEFTSQEKTWKLNLDPSQTIIFVPSLKNKGQELMVQEKSGLRWQTAFCKGDMISVRLADFKIIFIDNTGYRSCGFKGE